MKAKNRAKRTVRDYRNAQLTANTDLTSLTLRAMEEAAEEPAEGEQADEGGETEDEADAAEEDAGDADA